MTGVEAWTKMLTEGAKIRQDHMGTSDYMHLIDGVVVYRGGLPVKGLSLYINNEGWELYAEPTVTLAEAIACVMAGGNAFYHQWQIYDKGINCIGCKDVINGVFVDGWPANGWTITRGPS